MTAFSVLSPTCDVEQAVFLCPGEVPHFSPSLGRALSVVKSHLNCSPSSPHLSPSVILHPFCPFMFLYVPLASAESLWPHMRCFSVAGGARAPASSSFRKLGLNFISRVSSRVSLLHLHLSWPAASPDSLFCEVPRKYGNSAAMLSAVCKWPKMPTPQHWQASTGY